MIIDSENLTSSSKADRGSMFYTDIIHLPSHVVSKQGVISRELLNKTAEADKAAGQIIGEARKKADEILRNANNEALEITTLSEQRVLEKADELIKGLEALYASFFSQIADITTDLAVSVFNRLVAEMTAKEKVAFMVKRLLKEAPPKLNNAVLRVNPEDVTLLPEIEWDVKIDSDLQQGKCVLEASNGEWCVDFDLAIASLQKYLSEFSRFQGADETQ